MTPEAPLPAIGWQEICHLLDRSPAGPRQEAARWALDTLRNRLGDDWLGRAVRLGDGEFPLSLHLLGGHAHALAEALEWALRLEMCRGWDGSADFLRDLVRDPRPSRLLHSRAQLGQASFAEYQGWPVALEPSGGSSPADLTFIAPSGRSVAEIRVLTQSDAGRSQRETAEQLTDWLFWLGIEHDVWIGGELGREPDAAEQLEIEAFVKESSRYIGSGDRPRFSRAGISLELSERGSGAPALTSPPVREDLFIRMVRAIADKAEKMEASGAGWLHVTVLTGLWTFTSWASESLENKLATMASALRTALDGRCPEGIVLTSAASLAPEDVPTEVVRGEAGLALRTAAPPLRARESLILPMHQSAFPMGEDWLSLAEAEANWLSWALGRANLPRLAEVFEFQDARAEGAPQDVPGEHRSR